MAANDRASVLVEFASSDYQALVELWKERYIPKRTPEQIKEQGWMCYELPIVTFVGNNRALMRLSSEFFHQTKTKIPLTIITDRRSIEA